MPTNKQYVKTQTSVHHSGGSIYQKLSSIEEYHRTKDWGGGSRPGLNSEGRYLQYAWVLAPINGRWQWVKTGGENDWLWNCNNDNKKSIGIMVMGDYTEIRYNPEVRRLLIEKIEELQTRHPIKTIKGHKECSGASTECPGVLMEIINEYRRDKQQKLKLIEKLKLQLRILQLQLQLIMLRQAIGK